MLLLSLLLQQLLLTLREELLKLVLGLASIEEVRRGFASLAQRRKRVLLLRNPAMQVLLDQFPRLQVASGESVG